MEGVWAFLKHRVCQWTTLEKTSSMSFLDASWELGIKAAPCSFDEETADNTNLFKEILAFYGLFFTQAG